jgi:redox-regulated HSP33 family molecular chaperone
MPDGRKSEFKRIASLFADGTVSEQLEYDASVNTLREIFDLPDLATGPTRALAFGCTCSQSVAEASYATRSKPELDGLVRTARPQTFRCHLCGRGYTLTPEKLFQLALAAKP